MNIHQTCWSFQTRNPHGSPHSTVYCDCFERKTKISWSGFVTVAKENRQRILNKLLTWSYCKFRVKQIFLWDTLKLMNRPMLYFFVVVYAFHCPKSSNPRIHPSFPMSLCCAQLSWELQHLLLFIYRHRGKSSEHNNLVFLVSTILHCQKWLSWCNKLQQIVRSDLIFLKAWDWSRKKL